MLFRSFLKQFDHEIFFRFYIIMFLLLLFIEESRKIGYECKNDVNYELFEDGNASVNGLCDESKQIKDLNV